MITLSKSFTEDQVKAILNGTIEGIGFGSSMSFEDFEDRMVSEIRDHLPEDFEAADVSCLDMETSRCCYRGLTVRKEGSNAAPVVDLTELYGDVLEGESFDEVAKKAADIIKENQLKELAFDWAQDWEKAKDKLVFLCVPDKGQAFIKRALPGDICLVPAIDADFGHCVVNSQLLQHYGIGEDELWEAAFTNASKCDPSSLVCSLSSIVAETGAIGFPVPDDPMLIVGANIDHGAAFLFYPGVQEHIRERLGTDFWCIPSSIHDWIIFPEGVVDPEVLHFMLMETNEVVVAECDRLSNTVFHYSDEYGFETAEQFLSH